MVDGVVVVVTIGRVVDVVSMEDVVDAFFESEPSLWEESEPARAEITPRSSPRATTPAVIIHFVFVGHWRFTHTRAIPIGQQHKQATTIRAMCSYHCAGFGEPPNEGS